jgi:hypothetical protein
MLWPKVGVTDGASPTSVTRPPTCPRAHRRGGPPGTPGIIIDSHNHLLLSFDEDGVAGRRNGRRPPAHRRVARRTDLDWICAETRCAEGRSPTAGLDRLTVRQSS